MWNWILLVAGGVLGLVALLLGGLVVAMRTKYAPVLRRFTRLQRRFANPRALRTAGTPGSPWAVVRHVGRTSGARYETPVGVVETDDGFVIALPYGTTADWVKNVLAAGSAGLTYDGTEFAVGDPQVMPATAVDLYASRMDEYLQRMFGVDQCLVLTREQAGAGAGNGR